MRISENKQTDIFILLRSNKILKIAIYLMMLSFFYNLPIIGYSLKGDNELRIYDFVGIYLFRLYFKHRKYINSY
ncbi:hypothetical protein BWK59_13920, partial [Flavobacterium davisii]